LPEGRYRPGGRGIGTSPSGAVVDAFAALRETHRPRAGLRAAREEASLGEMGRAGRPSDGGVADLEALEGGFREAAWSLRWPRAWGARGAALAAKQPAARARARSRACDGRAWGAGALLGPQRFRGRWYFAGQAPAPTCAEAEAPGGFIRNLMGLHGARRLQ